MTLPSRPSVDDSLVRIRSLLNEQELVRGLVHKTEMRRHEVVEDLVARQYRNELRRQMEETRHIVNAQSLAWMKPTAYVINTARGPMVDSPSNRGCGSRGTWMSWKE